MNSITVSKNKTKRLLLTGSTSGIGYKASLYMLNAGYSLILPCRDELTSKNLRKRLDRDSINKKDFSKRIQTPIIDLSDLESIENCACKLISNDEPIDSLILNAGLQYAGSNEPKWSFQNYELTFAVNHLAHQYLAIRMLSLLYKSSEPRIIITASDVHNPEAAGGQFGKPADLGDLKGIKSDNRFSMIDGNSIFDADKAYKDSKLCNVLFAKELHKRLTLTGRNMPVIAWAPGLVIPRSKNGFFRYSRKYNEFGQRIFAFVTRDLLNITESPEKAGEILFMLATSSEYCEPGFSYFSNKVVSLGKRNFEKSIMSKDASDGKLAELLWEETINLLRKSTNYEIGKIIPKP